MRTISLLALTVCLGVATSSAHGVVSGTHVRDASSTVAFVAGSRARALKQRRKVARSSTRYVQRRPARTHEAQENNLPPNLGFGLGR